MDQGASSRTALTVAVQRAIHQVADEEPKILVDPIAARLVEAAAPGMLARELETAHLPRWRRGRAQWVVRSRFMEDELAARAPEGVDQFVILGAGLDTFAYRQPAWATGLRIFEVDHPSTQERKRVALPKAGIPIPANLTWCRSTSSTIRSSSGGVVVTFWDITERRAAELAKEETIGIVSHEIRSPLTGRTASRQLPVDGRRDHVHVG